MTQTAARRGFRLDIEGLRGVAVFAVVAFHVGAPWFGGGFVGVDVFFVISGFLITGILLKQTQGGRVHLLDFWARRIRRLVPALAVVVIATLLLSLLVYSPLAWPRLATEASASSLYISNLLFASDATSYFALPLGDSPYLHTWSLGVEEQFYLAWPLIFLGLALLLGRRGIHRAVAVALLALVAVGSFVLCLWVTHRAQPWAFFSSPTRAWEFALGGLAAVVASGRASVNSRHAAAVGWAGLIAIAYAVVRFDDFTLYPGTAALLPVFGSVALLSVGNRSGGLGAGRVLAWSPLVWLGGLSYTWYLWHWPLIVLVSAAWPHSGLAARSGAAVVALALAWVTTRFLENPIRFRSPFTQSRRWTYAGGLAATFIAVGLAVGVVRLGDQQQTSDSHLTALAAARSDRAGMTPASCTAVPAATGEPCASGDLRSTKTVMLLGDSHAASWRPAVDQVGKALGVKVVMSTYGGCPATDLPVAREGTHQPRPTCEPGRAQTAALIDAIHPDAVLLAQADYDGLILGDHGELISTADQEARWQAALTELAVDLDKRGIPLGLLLDIPVLELDPVECLAKGGGVAECGTDQKELQRIVVRDAAERTAVAGHGEVFDPLPFVCPDNTCPLEQDGVIIYSDTEHLTRAFVRRLVPRLQPFVQSLIA